MRFKAVSFVAALSVLLYLAFHSFKTRPAAEPPSIADQSPISPSVPSVAIPAPPSPGQALAAPANPPAPLSRTPQAVWALPATEPEFAAFQKWVARFQAAPAADQAALEAEGVALAGVRIQKMAELIQNAPEQAIALAVPDAVRRQLPASVTALTENWVHQTGHYDVVCVTPKPAAGKFPLAPLVRHATIDGAVHRVFTSGRALDYLTRAEMPINGIAVPMTAAVRPPADVAGRAPTFLMAMSALADGSDAGFDTPVTPGNLPTAESTFTEGRKRYLLMRVDFPDFAGDVFPTNNALAHMRDMSNFLAAISYNKHIIAPVGKGSDITPVMRMSNPAASYDNQGLSVLYPEARTVAQNLHRYDLSKYDFVFVCTGSRPSYDYAGLGYVGSVGYHLANGFFDVRTSAHELGHNLGLGHANWWDSGNRSTIGPGNNEEYGDPFDTMGGSGGGSRHFSASQKNRLDWIPAADAITVSTSGIYRLHAHDITTAPVGIRAIRLNRPSGNPYWLEFRQLWTSNKGMMNGVNFRWAGSSSQLLDMTPGSSAGKDDHSLTIGRTFSDPGNNLHVTPTRKGNTHPESLDVAIHFGPFPANQPPVAVASASASTAAPAQSITFTATATDPNGDALAYFWDFGDGDYSVDNSATTTHSFAAAGEYYVEVTVSDMKGGVARDAVIITVASPTTFTISGRVLNQEGQPITGIRVSTSGSRYAVSESDGTYTISRLAAGSYSVTALDPIADALNFVSPFFNNPITVGPDATNVDFIVTTAPPPNLTPLIAGNSSWRYLDDGSDQGTEWLGAGFIDLLWASGPGQLGYGDPGIATTLSFGGNPQNKHLTYYFRKNFTVANPAAFSSLRLGAVFDDGIVVYLNGNEIYRNNMPAGATTHLTPATSTTDAGDYFEQTISLSHLVAGDNTIAAEIHQANRTSSDIAFDLKLDGVTQPGGISHSVAYITSPSANQTFANPASLNIAAFAQSTLGAVTRAEFLVDGAKIGEDTTSPLSFNWTAPTAGTHQLSVVATFGTTTITSAPTRIIIHPAPALSITLTSPDADHTVHLPASINLTADATAGPAPISSVEFFANGLTVGQDNSAPYTATLAESSPGPKQIIARATDTLGNTATSAPVTITFTESATGDQLVSFGDLWKYLDDGSNLGTAWRAPGFNDRNWAAGPGRLGYGSDGEATTVSFGPSASQRFVTTYFRRTFTVAHPAAYNSLLLRLIRDDGAVVYLNGVEVLRDNLPSGLVYWNSLATTTIDGAGETTPVEAHLNPALLRTGTNVLAVEIHQAAINSSDVGFDLALAALETSIPSQPIYLTQPGAGARFNTPAHIQLASYTSTADGLPQSVQYYANGSLLGTGQATPPYSFTWSNAPVGSHLLTAVARQSAVTSTSAPVEVTVDRAVPSIIPVNSALIGQNATWRYWDNTIPVAAGWQTRDFDDSAWQSGPARFGWGLDAENTTLTDGRITHYFRRWFATPSTPAFYHELAFLLARDDGAVVYLNGTEIFRSNMPDGPITPTTPALNSVNTPDETTYFEWVISTAGSGILTGTNLLAVELHQNSATSSDGGFDLLLNAHGSSAARVYLTTPAQGATFTGSSTVDIEALAKGPGASAATNIEFYANGEKLAERTSAPWRVSWSNAPLGVFQLTARSRDALGFVTVSDPLEIAIGRESVTTTLVQSNSTWRYSDTGSDLGTNWTRLIYPESAWKTGVTRLGYGGDGETLPAVSFGGNSANKHITTYFRRTFVVQPGAVYTNLTFMLLRDDAAVVWLNGREQFRSNLPAAPTAITFQTLASASVGGAEEQTFFATTLPADDLVVGTNILAVEIHQQARDSSDLGFNLQLIASGYEDAETPPSLVVFYADDLVELRWPATAVGWQVYSASAIDAPANGWTPAPGSLLTVSGQNVFTTAPGTGNQFFRLQKQ